MVDVLRDAGRASSLVARPQRGAASTPNASVCASFPDVGRRLRRLRRRSLTRFFAAPLPRFVAAPLPRFIAASFPRFFAAFDVSFSAPIFSLSAAKRDDAVSPRVAALVFCAVSTSTLLVAVFRPLNHQFIKLLPNLFLPAVPILQHFIGAQLKTRVLAFRRAQHILVSLN